MPDASLADGAADASEGVPFGCICTDGFSGCPAGQTLCSGTCVDERTDPNDCGGCGVACAGTCTFGRCLVTLAAGQLMPYSIAVDATHVYWTDQAAGTVVKMTPK